MKRALSVVLALALSGACAGCGLLLGRPMPVERASGVLPTGVQWRDTFAGIGALAGPRDRVLLHWTAALGTGRAIDSTYGRGKPEAIDLARPPFLGLADGVVGMRSGGRREIVVPPHRAYGHLGLAELVPPDATLVLEVELLAVLAPGHGSVDAGQPARH